jgi:hypothetical protein
MEDLSDWDDFMTPVDCIQCFPPWPDLPGLEASPSWPCPVGGCLRVYRRKHDLRLHASAKHADLADLHRALANPKSTQEGKAVLCPHATCRCGFATKKNLLRHLKRKHDQPQRRAGILAVASLLFPSE